MPTHPIRLRKAWEISDMRTIEGPPGRLDLPVSSPSQAALPERARLVRTFGSPTISPDAETLALQFENVVGLRAIFLNDRPLPIPEPMPEQFEIPLAALPARNRLVLDVDFPAPSTHLPSSIEGWGAISLVIRSGESSA